MSDQSNEFFEIRIRELVTRIDRLRIDPTLSAEERTRQIAEAEMAISATKRSMGGQRTISGELLRPVK